MKTVFNFQNIAKSAALIALTAAAWSVACWAFDIGPAWASGLGLLLGITAAELSLVRWRCWHFE